MILTTAITRTTIPTNNYYTEIILYQYGTTLQVSPYAEMIIKDISRSSGRDLNATKECV
jgi:hypothetical protein